ncbi:hypothetical protein F0U44_21920 [Nocardioides humilatus]|uniref:Uncharacterized protein n=1 Tax=Nocardioides humilatus TaxID=2607660 RepID=A0A5B1L3W4_9ACTN|nr:hypothetical protein [Nocardioides humilatus]KAA1415343.1 hypothetical protein F0U44_21920 [Nocardioides humilatus]
MRRVASVATLFVLLGVAACSEKGADEPDAAPSTQATQEGKPGKHDDREGDTGEPGEEASDLADLAEDLANQDSGNIPPRDGEIDGADISWPQCPKGMGIPERRTQGLPMPEDDAEFVVVGLTNGPGFTPNPCLADQVTWVQDRALMAAAYSVVSYPDAATLEQYSWDGPFDGSNLKGQLRNVGYQEARFNLDTMISAELQTPIIWIDVEPVPDFEWSADKAANAAVVEGAARAYTDAGFSIGIYSTPYLWETVVGGYSLGVPEWRAAGQTSRDEALNRCGEDWSIQGGAAILGQWVEGGRDHNVTCPDVAGDLGRWFHQY